METYRSCTGGVFVGDTGSWVTSLQEWRVGSMFPPKLQLDKMPGMRKRQGCDFRSSPPTWIIFQRVWRSRTELQLNILDLFSWWFFTYFVPWYKPPLNHHLGARCFKGPFQGLSDLYLGDQKVTTGEILGGGSNGWRSLSWPAYFSNRLVQPPTSIWEHMGVSKTETRKQRCAASRFACFSFLLISLFFRKCTVFIFFLEV